MVKKQKMQPGVHLLTLLLALLMLAAPAAYAAASAEENGAMPVAEGQRCAVFQDARVQGKLRAGDPDGGALTFEIVKAPKKGTVVLDEADSSKFVYTAAAGKSGKDSFTFRAIDDDGNASQEAKVEMEILKGKTGVRYADMAENAAHTAAVRLAEEGVFTGRQVGNAYFFGPEETVSRGEFLTMAMAAAGMDTRNETHVTGFSDDESIPTWAKVCAGEALNRGVIAGKMENDRVVFSAEEAVSYNEAAAILNRLMAVADVDAAAFAGENVPAWAVQSVANLAAAEVMEQREDYSAPLTRATAAEMLCAAMELTEEKDGGLLSWLK